MHTPLHGRFPPRAPGELFFITRHVPGSTQYLACDGQSYTAALGEALAFTTRELAASEIELLRGQGAQAPGLTQFQVIGKRGTDVRRLLN